MTIRTSAEPGTTLPGGPPRRSHSRLLLAVIAVVAVGTGLVVAASQLGGHDADVATTATQEPSAAPSVTTPFDPQAATKAAVIAAYTQSYKAIIVVGKEAAPNPNDPRLSQHTSGPALAAVQRAIADNNSKGLVYFGDAELHPTIIELGPDTATVVDCSIDQTGLRDRRTGAIVEDGGPAKGGASTAKLRLEAGVWKVTDFKDEKRSCVPPAA